MKKNLVNILIIFALAISFYAIYIAQSDIRLIEEIQYKVLPVILVSSVLLAYLNHKNYKQALKNRWWWMIFKVLGILGMAYAGFVLFALFLFKDCCGF